MLHDVRDTALGQMHKHRKEDIFRQPSDRFELEEDLGRSVAD